MLSHRQGQLRLPATRLTVRQADRVLMRWYRLSAARLGWRSLPVVLAQGLVAGFCISCPESAGDRPAGHARDWCRHLLRAAARSGKPADAGHDPHGRCQRSEEAGVPSLPRRCETMGRKNPERRERAAVCARLHYALGEILIYGPLQEPFSAFPRSGWPTRQARRSGPICSPFYRSLGINLKQLYGQTEAVPLCHLPARWRDLMSRPSAACCPQCRNSHRRPMAKCCYRSPSASSVTYLQRSARRRPRP